MPRRAPRGRRRARHPPGGLIPAPRPPPGCRRRCAAGSSRRCSRHDSTEEHSQRPARPHSRGGSRCRRSRRPTRLVYRPYPKAPADQAWVLAHAGTRPASGTSPVRNQAIDACADDVVLTCRALVVAALAGGSRGLIISRLVELRRRRHVDVEGDRAETRLSFPSELGPLGRFLGAGTGGGTGAVTAAADGARRHPT